MSRKQKAIAITWIIIIPILALCIVLTTTAYAEPPKGYDIPALIEHVRDVLRIDIPVEIKWFVHPNSMNGFVPPNQIFLNTEGLREGIIVHEIAHALIYARYGKVEFSEKLAQIVELRLRKQLSS